MIKYYKFLIIMLREPRDNRVRKTTHWLHCHTPILILSRVKMIVIQQISH